MFIFNFYSTAEAQLAAIAHSQEAQQNTNTLTNIPDNISDSGDMDDSDEILPKGLIQWRDAVSRSHTSAQLAMALYVLESCVAWDKSIMKAVSFIINFHMRVRIL